MEPSAVMKFQEDVLQILSRQLEGMGNIVSDASANVKSSGEVIRGQVSSIHYHVSNAQDALNAVDAWLRKGDAPTDDQILTINVNSDSRINTFDALGIVEKFVDDSDFGVVIKAATITTNP